MAKVVVGMAAKGEQKKEMSFTEKDEKEEEKWIMHYSSKHQILLVGEGDFSFSFALSQKFGSASNICASSLDSYETVVKKFKEARSNLDTLKKLGASIIHGVDATEMKEHSELSKRKFDRIIFNFPHAGFHGKEEDDEVIRMHMSLVEGFFRNASGMLRPHGEVHVSHKTTAPFCKWHIEELARKHSLLRLDCVQFRKEDYPGYSNKKGAGSLCDDYFPLGKCSTFKFGLYRARKGSKVMSDGGFIVKRTKAVQEIPIQVQKRETDPFDWRCTNAKSATDMNEFRACVKFDGSGAGYPVREYPRFDSLVHPQTSFTRNAIDHPGYKRLALMGNARFHNGCFNSSHTTLGRAVDDVGYLVPESLIPYERYYAEVAGFQRENGRSYDKTVPRGRTLYPVDGRCYQETMKPAQPSWMRLGFSYQL